MTCKRVLYTGAIVILLAATPGLAASFGFQGAYWDTKDADHGFGGGIRSGSDLGRSLSLDFAATYFDNLAPSSASGAKLRVAPFDVGLSFRVPTDAGLQPYLGGGASYYWLDSNLGSIKDEVGWYAKAGFEIGRGTGPHFFAEAMYRDVSGTIKRRDEALPDVSSKVNLQLRGLGANAGLLWRW